MGELYYIDKINRGKKNIIQVVICAILGTLAAVYVSSLMNGTIDFNIMLELLPIFVGLPYGLLKTWKSCLILTSASSDVWIMWIFYIAIKITIAVVYGTLAMPIVLICSVYNIIISSIKLKEHNSMTQSNIYFGDGGYYET